MNRTMSDLRAMTDWLYPLLRCPVCQGELEFRALDASRAQGLLLHSRPGCDEVYPVIDDVPRMLVGTARAEVVRARRDWFAAHPETVALGALWSGGTQQTRSSRVSMTSGVASARSAPSIN